MTEQDNHSCEVYHFDLYGTREEKYRYLQTHNLNDVEWQQLTPQAPSFFFVPKDFSLQQEYEQGFEIDELMKVNTSGIKTHHDAELVSYESFSNEYDQIYAYRPFDNRHIDYDLQKVVRHRFDKMRHMINHDNLSLIICKQQSTFDFQHVFCTNLISDINSISLQSKEISYVFPLYLYPEEGSIDTSRRPNLDEKIWAQINTAIGKEATPEDIFDYIYGILHSPSYRAKYKEFLKVDFPRIPYPKDQTEFEHFRSFGNQLRELHLMHNVPESPVTFPNAGSMQVDALRWEWNKDDGYSGNVYINETQCFEGVPAEAWDFYIGGYQPAQKWLKDRKGRTLSFDDIEHYRKIISVLMETSRLMKKIG